MTRTWFLLPTFGLFLTAAFSQNLSKSPKPWTDYEYSRKLQYVLDILWESFTTEIRNKNNALVLAIPSLTDIYFNYNSMDKETKKLVVRYIIPAFEISQTEFVT